MAEQVFTHDKKEYCLFDVGASPHAPGVYRFVEYRMGRKGKGRANMPCPSVYPPASALGSLPSVALSSGQVRILY
jgi:hypothetical protein